MTDLRQIANAYLALWNDPDPAQRRARLAAGWTVDARYADPLMQGEGQAEIAAIIEAARAQFPGHRFTLRGTPDGHGPHLRFSWTLAAPGGALVAGGTDIAQLDREGRVRAVTGFLDAVRHD